MRKVRLNEAKGAESTRSDWSQSTRDFYEHYASEYAASTLHAPIEPLLSVFAARLPVGGNIVDLGCGAGRDLALFRRHALRPVGLDNSRALSLLAHRYSGAPVIVGDLRCLPFARKVFDGVWGVASLLHLRREDIAGALAKVRRVLRPNGLVFTSMKRGSGEDQDKHGRWFSYFAPAEWTAHLKDAGFEVLDTKFNYECRRSSLSTEEICWINCTAHRK